MAGGGDALKSDNKVGGSNPGIVKKLDFHIFAKLRTTTSRFMYTLYLLLVDLSCLCYVKLFFSFCGLKL